MSLSLVRPFFRSRMNALNFREHDDAFDLENNPQSILDRSYLIESGPVAIESTGPTTFNLDYDVTLRVFLKGGRDNKLVVDEAFGVADTILADISDSQVRLDGDLENALPTGVTVEPLSGTNDNDVILSISFTGRVICNYN